MTNSRFEELEARCKKLRFKRNTKVFVFILCTFTLIGIVLNANFLFLQLGHYMSSITTEVKQLETQHVIVNNAVEEENNSLGQKNESIDLNETNVSSIGQEDFKLSLTINRERYPEKSIKEKSVDSLYKTTETVSKNVAPLQIQKEFDLSAPEQAPKTFSMSVTSLTSEEALLKSHASAPTFKTTYDVAFFYFEKNEYSKAIKWSKDANKLDPTSDKPWIIYAQSKYALMEREDAIKALEVFLQYVPSQEAKALLEKYRGQK